MSATIEEAIETLRFNAINLVAEDEKLDALHTLECARQVMHEVADALSSLPQPEASAPVAAGADDLTGRLRTDAAYLRTRVSATLHTIAADCEAAAGALAHPIQPKDDGWMEWIEWSGRGRPVFDGDYVHLRLRSGSEVAVIANRDLRWSHAGLHNDIMAYRIAAAPRFNGGDRG